MTVPLPELPGVRHAYHDLRTGVRLHVAEAGDPAAPALLAVHGWGRRSPATDRSRASSGPR